MWVSFNDEAAARLNEKVDNGSDRKGNRKTAGDFSRRQGNQQRCDGVLNDALRQLCRQGAFRGVGSSHGGGSASSCGFSTAASVPGRRSETRFTGRCSALRQRLGTLPFRAGLEETDDSPAGMDH